MGHFGAFGPLHSIAAFRVARDAQGSERARVNLIINLFQIVLMRDRHPEGSSLELRCKILAIPASGFPYYAQDDGCRALMLSTTLPTTLPQSPRLGWRNNRIVGYHGLSSRSSSQRQSPAQGSIVKVGRPRAPARWAAAVS